MILRKLLSPFSRLFGGTGMTKFVVRRILLAVPVMFMTLLATFVLVRLMPGGPFDNIGGKSPPDWLKAVWEARYGLDKPLFLNLPGDGVAPDSGVEYRQAYDKLPDCDKLRQGMSIKDATPAGDPEEVSAGWQLLHRVNEHSPSYIEIAGQQRRCDNVRSVLYSDLTRSQFFEYINNALRFDFGVSLGRTTLGTRVQDLVSDRLPVSA